MVHKGTILSSHVLSHLPSGRYAFATRNQRGAITLRSIGWITAGCIALFGLVVPIGLKVWQNMTPSVALRTANAGRFVSSTASPGGFFAPTLTSVQTTTATVTVMGTFSTLRGALLQITQLNKHGIQRLCVAGSVSGCAPLAAPWIGLLTPTPQASHAIDFERLGLTPDALTGWIAFGVLFLALSGLVALVLSVADASDDADDTAGDGQDTPALAHEEPDDRH